MFEASELGAQVGAIAKTLASLPPESMKLSRALIRGGSAAELEQVSMCMCVYYVRCKVYRSCVH